MWFSWWKVDVRKKRWQGEIKTKTEIEPPWHADAQGRRVELHAVERAASIYAIILYIIIRWFIESWEEGESRKESKRHARDNDIATTLDHDDDEHIVHPALMRKRPLGFSVIIIIL